MKYKCLSSLIRRNRGSLIFLQLVISPAFSWQSCQKIYLKHRHIALMMVELVGSSHLVVVITIWHIRVDNG
jgi:hypothetical protein